MIIASLFLALLPASGAPSPVRVVVYAKGDSIAYRAATPPPSPADPVRSALLRRFNADLDQPAALEKTLPLTEFPVWGRAVPGAAGEIQFHGSFRGAFVTRVSLTGLLPNHDYILTLNGNPEKQGNDRLPTPVPGNEREHYLDFQTVRTDSSGRYSAAYAIALAKGPYDVRFYVKDTSDFKIVLYHDFFPFRVE